MLGKQIPLICFTHKNRTNEPSNWWFQTRLKNMLVKLRFFSPRIRVKIPKICTLPPPSHWFSFGTPTSKFFNVKWQVKCSIFELPPPNNPTPLTPEFFFHRKVSFGRCLWQQHTTPGPHNSLWSQWVPGSQWVFSNHSASHGKPTTGLWKAWKKHQIFEGFQ